MAMIEEELQHVDSWMREIEELCESDEEKGEEILTDIKEKLHNEIDIKEEEPVTLDEKSGKLAITTNKTTTTKKTKKRSNHHLDNNYVAKRSHIKVQGHMDEDDIKAANEQRGYSITKVDSKVDKRGKTRPKMSCLLCNFDTIHSSEMRDHINIEHRKIPLECTECDYFTLKWKAISLHRSKIHHLGSLQCPECNFKGCVIWQMRQHMEEKHEGVEVEEFEAPTVKPPASIEKYQQKQKELAAMRPQNDVNYSKHTDPKSGEQYFTCNLCNPKDKKRFKLTSFGTLLIHINVVHIKKPLECMWCDYSSLNETTLTCHAKTKHQYKKKSCTQCSFATYVRCKWDEHQEKHKVPPHPALHKHLEEKPRSCVWCDYRTMKYLNLHAHSIRKHKKEYKKCIIPDCKFSAIYEERYQEHLFKKHGAYYDEKDHSIKFKSVDTES